MTPGYVENGETQLYVPGEKDGSWEHAGRVSTVEYEKWQDTLKAVSNASMMAAAGIGHVGAVFELQVAPAVRRWAELERRRTYLYAAGLTDEEIKLLGGIENAYEVYYTLTQIVFSDTWKLFEEYALKLKYARYAPYAILLMIGFVVLLSALFGGR